jgi:hypothetical protein
MNAKVNKSAKNALMDTKVNITTDYVVMDTKVNVVFSTVDYLKIDNK